MFIELHLIQNFAPACLNRDDTGTPKDCVFGGARRARISSQCLKRAARAHFAHFKLMEPAEMAVRTKRLADRLSELLQQDGKDPEAARRAAVLTIQATGIKTDEEKTSYLVYLSDAEIQALKKLILTHWDELAAAALQPIEEKPAEENPAQAEEKAPEEKPAKGKGKGKAKKDKPAGPELPEAMKKGVQKVFEGAKAADLALFGRMLADLPERNIDAACQVAHALSTHKVEMEMDFYTAVDDLKPDDSSGADMMGTVEFNSACFYRYAVVDCAKLLQNLGGDAELGGRTLRAFLQASAEALPTGKQNTFAAHNPPCFILAVAREGGVPWSLANAFEKPVWAPQGGLEAKSIEALAQHWGRLKRMYGDPKGKAAWIALDETIQPASLGAPCESFPALVETVMQSVRWDGKEGRP